MYFYVFYFFMHFYNEEKIKYMKDNTKHDFQ